MRNKLPSRHALVSAGAALAVIAATGVALGAWSFGKSGTSTVSPAATTSPSSTTQSGLTVTPATLSLAPGQSGSVQITNASGRVTVSVADPTIAKASFGSGRATVSAIKTGSTVLSVRDSKAIRNVAVVVSSPTSSASTTGGYAVVAWNDLGMHCVDGKDYSVMSILPPYNNLHAQVVNTSTGKQVTSGVTLTYEAVADPTGSINTVSSTKTNFWQYVKTLYGAAVAPEMGLAGNPMANKTPASMKYNTTWNWFEAEGIPITPYDDQFNKNYYPMVKVVAKDSTGKVLASTSTVLPVSDEMTCKACHASRSSGTTAQTAAKPTQGWAFDADAEKDWKRNILRLHDDKHLNTDAKYMSAITQFGYDQKGLAVTAANGRPILCASCHGSNALPGTGVSGISALTAAIHAKHSKVVDPSTNLALDSINNRSACYMCHPGSVTKCLRGAMGNAVDAQGNALMGCQSCHGTMAAVGASTRTGWLQQPNCQSCHHDGKRELTALDSTGKLRTVTDTRFATNPNKPATGFSLFRFSSGHGNLQCESCHGATHAEYPSSHTNDNLQSIALQGYAGTLHECTTCHKSVPLTATGGPHGMHTIGASWVDGHGDQVEKSGSAACTTCHGADYKGTFLAKVTKDRSFSHDGKTYALKTGTLVGCYNCHNGPKGD